MLEKSDLFLILEQSRLSSYHNLKTLDTIYSTQVTQGSLPSEHTIYFEVELLTEPNKVFFASKIVTQVKNFNDLDQNVIEFPIKIKDLPILT